MRVPSPIHLSVSGLLGLMLVLAGGCRALSAPEEPPRSTPARPLWSEAELREHLRFFNGADVEGRATGTIGYATAAAYVAARMAEFGLQPFMAGEFRSMYHSALNEMRGATLAALGPDTLTYAPGVDFLPDGRSDSGRVQITRLIVDPAGFGAAGPAPALPARAAVLLPAQQATTDYLRALRAGGARVAFTVGPLEALPAASPVEGLTVVQVAPWAAARMLDVSPARLDDLLRTAGRTVQPLPRPLRLNVQSRALPLAGAINVLGYVPGKNPALAGELVIVCSDLDAVGTFSGVPVLDVAHWGTSTAALLEVARQYAYFSEYTSVPERTLLFAVFSGARQGYAGLRDYLRHPLWPLDETRAVVYVRPDPPDAPVVHDLLAAHGLPLYVASPADTLRMPGPVLLPDRRAPRRRTVRPPNEEGPRVEPPRLADLINAGVLDALRMAEAVHALLLREAVTPALPEPSLPDASRVPVEN